VIGLNAEPEMLSCIQQGCREIVNQMVGDTEEYWLISFAEERLQATRKDLLSLPRKCGLDAASEERLSDLCRERANRGEREKTAWLLRVVTAELLRDSEVTPEIRLVLECARTTSQSAEAFDQVSIESQSPWDRRIRDLTPDLPTLLGDWVSVGVLAEAALDDILTHLSTEQQQLLRGRFKAAAMKVTGMREIELPDSW
jgi:hypothetical protein